MSEKLRDLLRFLGQTGSYRDQEERRSTNGRDDVGGRRQSRIHKKRALEKRSRAALVKAVGKIEHSRVVVEERTRDEGGKKKSLRSKEEKKDRQSSERARLVSGETSTNETRGNKREGRL